MVKEKRRNSEKRKEKSRDAARHRRSKETEIFTELAHCLPLTEGVTGQLDKASIMRLAISVLRIGDVLDAVGIVGDAENTPDDRGNKYNNDGDAVFGFDSQDCKDTKPSLQTVPDSHMYMKGLDGMVFILSHDGDIVYLSENVTKYLGLQQIEVMGQYIYDYIHPCDHEEMKEVLHTKIGTGHVADDSYGDIVNFSIRLKCTLTSKGRSVNLKSAPYKVMKCCGRLVSNSNTSSHQDGPSSSPSTSSSSSSTRPYLLLMMEPIPHPSDIEVPLDSSTFLSKHEMDMRFSFCDERIEELAGYDPKAMEGQSFFDFHHAMDSELIKKTFKDLFFKGQAVTCAYRMLVANGGYIWLVTQATTINNSRNQKPQSVVCVHYVLSCVEEKGIILSNIQQTLAAGPLVETPPPSPATTPMVPLPASKIPSQLDLLPPKLELSTESIFVPKTKDMDKGFCRPDLPAYVLTNSIDLVCLSPTAGEENIPLPFNTYSPAHTTDFLTSPMLPVVKSPGIGAMKQEQGLLSPGQCLGQGRATPCSPASHVSSTECSAICSPEDYLGCASVPLELDTMDKFFSCISSGGDESDTASGGGLQPLETPPTPLSMPLTISVEKVEGIAEEELADIDFAFRAPYIPMDGDQDLDLLPPSSSTLFNLSKDDINPSVFGRTEFVFGPKQALFEDPKPVPKMSVRDMLGESTAMANIEQPPSTLYLQMKRPLDMNCLEKGPPVAKVARLEESDVTSMPVQSCQTAGEIVSAKGTKNSVLLNLLLNGEDNNYGYKVCHKPQMANMSKPKPQQVQMFDNLTNQDCEVNAPTRCYRLLQGQELLNALDR